MNSGEKKWLDPVSGRPITTHGFRATFRTWAEEVARFPHAVVEQAMGHQVGTQVERAYRRTDVLDNRPPAHGGLGAVARAEGRRQTSYRSAKGMSDMVILGPLEFHGAIDAWLEYLCVERRADGSLELSSRSRELLGYSGDEMETAWSDANWSTRRSGRGLSTRAISRGSALA